MSEDARGQQDDPYQIVIVRYGTREATRAEVFLDYDVYDRRDGPLGMDYDVWAIRNAARTRARRSSSQDTTPTRSGVTRRSTPVRWQASPRRSAVRHDRRKTHDPRTRSHPRSL